MHTAYYESPLGRIILASEEDGLCGLWFEGQKYIPEKQLSLAVQEDDAVLNETKSWLNSYFAGKQPEGIPPLHLQGTPFRIRVWNELLQIPYGSVMTYGELAQRLQRDGSRCSARAVGGAVGHNPVSIIVPCHRIIGADGSLTGYAGGTERKKALLTMERAVW